jgi:ATP-dependent RNA helicase DeaD
MKFNEFALSDPILQALEKMGFEEATEIQEKALPLLLEQGQEDFIGLAQTGTGKTAAFGLPIIQKVPAEAGAPAALILSPTRELCLQISGEMERFAAGLPGIRITPVYGGADIRTQISSIRRGSQVVVATPGRLADLIRRGVIDLSGLRQLVLDEADIMLNMGFKEELDQILETTPEGKQVILLSATMPPEVARIASTYMHEPREITVGRANASTGTIEHRYTMVHSKDKYQALKRLLDFHPDIYGMVFCRTKAATQRIADQLSADGYNSAAIHGDLSQAQRDQVMNAFRDRGVQILVATDVAARGIDVESITHVIHYDLPDEAENYVHRSGRTGRAGRTGISIAIINMKERGRIKRIERMMNSKIVQVPVPTGEQICRQQLINLIDRVHDVKVDQERIGPHMALIEEKLAAFDREELLKHFVSLEFNRFLSYYQNAPDINPAPGRDDSRRGAGDRDGFRGEGAGADFKKRGRKGNDAFVTIRINLGRKDRINPPQIIALVNESTRMRDIEIGKINIEERYSQVMIDRNYGELVLAKLSEFHFRGRPIIATTDGGGGKGSGGYARDGRGAQSYRRGSGKAAGKGGGGGKQYGNKSGKKGERKGY